LFCFASVLMLSILENCNLNKNMKILESIAIYSKLVRDLSDAHSKDMSIKFHKKNDLRNSYEK
jgi:hypothetical protein